MNRWLLVVFLFLTCAAPNAFAQSDAPLFDYQIEAKVQTDQGAPMLVLRAKEFIKSGTVEMERSDGNQRSVKIGQMKPGQEKRIPLKQPKGGFKWTITVSGESQFNQTMNQKFETETAWVDPIVLSVNPELVNVSEGKLTLRSNVPLDRVDIEVFNKAGDKVAATTQALGGKGGDVEISWPPAGSEVSSIRLQAHDIAGFWSAVLLEPFWVDIAHAEVEFHFGKSTWDDSENAKLKDTLAAVHEAMESHRRKGLQMQLYIAGYTDTVGGSADNMALSTARARAIAAWFRKSGLDIPLLYQGFGESVLAVTTPDNTPEARNRRALYILGNAPPPTSAVVPKRSWKRL